MDAYIQPTASGLVTSGTFGCVRNHGTRFHEGIDIKSVHRNRRNRPVDLVRAILPGNVVYVNSIAGKSTYGRYVVLRHTLDSFSYYSLYAHLNEIYVQLNQTVQQGTALGIMGNTSCSKIPLSRAHLHFEIGLSLGSKDTFHAWYSKQGFKEPNFHGEWNGMNLVGLDPLEFFKSGTNFLTFVKNQPIAFTLQIATSTTPHFIQQNQTLLTTPLQAQKTLCGWEIAFNWLGCPLRWTPLYGLKLPASIVRVLHCNSIELSQHGCRHTLQFNKRGQAFLGHVLQRQLAVLFNSHFQLTY
ncbi:MAG: M23 family metallopeptidase [Puniceicoccales bacterium]|jgi:murein DD-endopeptidase MepM/ murein hydrolase activator NlpD|nr:M23 family metallopeptidase [Puniceicoccales bacterium]